jgi:hypothetical protein
MADDPTVSEKAAEVSDLMAAMEGAEEASSGLGRAFADTAKSGNILWTVMGRLLSGSGLWRLQNRIRAVGNALQIYYEAQEKTRKAEIEKVKMTATLIEAEEKLLQIKKENFNTEDKLFKVYSKVYGVELAKEKLKERATDTLDRINKSQAKNLKLTAEELERKIVLSKQSVKDYNFTKELDKRMLAARRKGGLTTALKTAESATGKDRDREKIRYLKEDLEAAAKKSDKLGEEYQRMKGLRDVGIEEMEKKTKFGAFELKGRKFPGIEITKIPKPLRLIGSQIKAIANFTKGVGKFLLQFLKAALSALWQGMLYIGIIILAVILLKPVFLAFWESWKTFGPPLLKNINMYWQNIKPVFTEIYAAAREFIGMLFDPKATFLDTLLSFGKLLLTILAGTLKIFFQFVLPIAMDVAMGLVVMVLGFIPIFIGKVLTGIGDLYLTVRAWVLEKYMELLDGHPTLAALFMFLTAGIWGPILMIETLYNWITSSSRIWNKKTKEEKAAERAEKVLYQRQLVEMRAGAAAAADIGRIVGQPQFQLDPNTGEKVYYGYINTKGTRVPKKYYTMGSNGGFGYVGKRRICL